MCLDGHDCPLSVSRQDAAAGETATIAYSTPVRYREMPRIGNVGERRSYRDFAGWCRAGFAPTLHGMLIVASALSASLLLMPTVNATPVSSPDQAFVTMAAQFGLEEIRLAGLALRTSSTPRIVRFAMSTRNVASGYNVRLMSIAGRQHMTLPIILPARFEAARTGLQSESGPGFDRRYLTLEVDANEQTASAFEREANRGESAALRNFARRAIPALQQQLQLARRDIAALH